MSFSEGFRSFARPGSRDLSRNNLDILARLRLRRVGISYVFETPSTPPPRSCKSLSAWGSAT